MRLSNLRLGFCPAAAHFALALAMVLLFSSNTVAQHSSGGGGSTGGSSSSGGGGSHGGGSGGSSSSGGSGGHSSGGSSSHGSSGHSSSTGSTSSRVGASHPSSSHSGVLDSHSGATHSMREPNAGMRGKSGTEKRGFFSILRHPFRKPQPKPEPRLTADLRRPICFRGPCPICPTGLARGRVGCGGSVVYAHRGCAAGEGWNGIACLEQNHSPYDCSAQRMAMEQQAQRMHAAEASQQSACSTGTKQECEELTSGSQNEATLYGTLQARYRSCQQRGLRVNPFGHSASAGYSQGLSFYPLEFDSEYR